MFQKEFLSLRYSARHYSDHSLTLWPHFLPLPRIYLHSHCAAPIAVLQVGRVVPCLHVCAQLLPLASRPSPSPNLFILPYSAQVFTDPKSNLDASFLWPLGTPCLLYFSDSHTGLWTCPHYSMKFLTPSTSDLVLFISVSSIPNAQDMLRRHLWIMKRTPEKLYSRIRLTALEQPTILTSVNTILPSQNPEAEILSVTPISSLLPSNLQTCTITHY